MLMRLGEQWVGEVPVAALAGEVDASNSSEIGERLRGLLSNHSHVLVVDLTSTTYLDSAGINMLFTLADEMRRRQQELRLVIAQGSPIARMAGLTGLDRAIAAHATVEEATA